MDKIDELIAVDVAPELSGLEHDQIVEMIQMYYAREYTVADIISKYGLKVTPGKLVSLFPPQLDEETLCRHCHNPMYRRWASRTASSRGYLSDDAVCETCGHQDYGNSWSRCSCSACFEERQQERIKKEMAERKRQQVETDLIAEIYGEDRTYDPYADVLSIDLKSAIYLLAMERQSVSGDVGLFSPLCDSEIGLAPDADLSKSMLRHLAAEDLIRVDPNSSRDAFLVEGDKVKHYFYRVNYYANFGNNVVESKENLALLESVFRSREWPEHWKYDWRDEIKSIWMELSLRDCMQYLQILGDERGFDMPQGDKTKTTILGALQDFSVSTLYSFMWSAARAASDYYMTANVPKKQAANSVVGKIQTNADKVRIGEYAMRKHHRCKGFVDNALFEVLFYTVLQIGEKGFTESMKDCFAATTWIDAENSPSTEKVGRAEEL